MTAMAVVEQPTLKKDAVASVAGQITKLGTGDHALLRRMFLTEKPAADGVVVKLLLRAGLEPHEYEPDYAAWQAMVHIAALLSGTGKTNPHNPKHGFGTALHEAKYSPNRFLRLTAARGEALRDQVVLAGRMLAKTSGQAINLRTVLRLLGKEQGRAEYARLKMAGEYYSAEMRTGEDNT